VLADVTFSRLAFVFPAEQRRDADDGRQDPYGSDHRRHPSRSPLHGVLERTLDDEIPVDADGAQVEYRRGTEENIERRPDVTNRLTEHPPTHHCLHMPRPRPPRQHRSTVPVSELQLSGLLRRCQNQHTSTSLAIHVRDNKLGYHSSLFTIYGRQKKHTQMNKQTHNTQTKYTITE